MRKHRRMGVALSLGQPETPIDDLRKIAFQTGGDIKVVSDS